MLLRTKLLCWMLVGLSMSCVLGSVALGQLETSDSQTRLADDLKYLSADALAGRDVGSEGIAAAGEFVAGEFAKAGLEVNAFDGSPFQNFSIPGPAQLGSPENNRLSVTGTADPIELTLGENYTPVTLGNSGAFSGPIVFAGYGITAPDLNYDDYASVDVAGKVVIVLRKEPKQNDPASKFDGQRSSQFAFFSSKELNAVLHQASALLIVNDSLTAATEGQDRLPDINAAGSAATDAQLPTFYITRAVVDQLLSSSGQKSLAELEGAIDENESPQSLELPSIQASGETRIEKSQIAVRNVVGFLPGAGSLADEYVVIGAHYDHVGMGGAGSLAPGTIEIHNGADDNASGTVTLLEVARELSQRTAESRRGVVFIAFTGEERGLLGSKHYARNPRWPIEKTVAMLNMDMVGRLQSDTLTVYGTGTAAEFDELITRQAAAVSLALDKQPAGFGPSDHASFYELDIPVFHFFTGLHNDYHRPSDDFEKVNISGLSQIARLVANVATEVATSVARPTLIKSSAVAQIAGPGRGRNSNRRRAVLGVRLANATGSVLIDSVVQGEAADRAGLLAGDLITSISGEQVESLEALQKILAGKKPGDTISVSVVRDNQTVTIDVTLSQG